MLKQLPLALLTLVLMSPSIHAAPEGSEQCEKASDCRCISESTPHCVDGICHCTPKKQP